MVKSWGPNTLADAISSPHGGTCPLPATHDRLDECHYWWHQMAKNYHEPPYFRWTSGAFIQAARNVTWMIQSEKALFRSFAWYEEWQGTARATPLLKWLNVSRVTLTKRSPLAPTSWARFRCLVERENADYEYDDDLYISLNPFLCTHAYIRSGPVEDHGHEYQRCWEIAELPGRELLDVAAEVYDLISDVVERAHVAVGSSFGVARRSDGRRIESPAGWHRLPCMNETERFRTVRTYVIDGEERWDDGPAHL